MAAKVNAATVKAWLRDGGEIAFIDVREAGQYGEGHPFHATSVPFSRFEPEIVRLVPNNAVRMVLLDDGDGIADRAAGAAEALGYRNVSVVDGGADGWRKAGFTLFKGVNVPSKTFGEILEHARHTPRITADELNRRYASGEKIVIVDGRPFAEYRKMNIPGGICCPNGELALRIDEVVSDPATRIVVNCAGRTRSIIGAETLIAAGVENEVLALENGTQGWFLAGLELERGATRRHASTMPPSDRIAERREHVRSLADGRGVRFASPRDVAAWMKDPGRTMYLLDVRTPEEFAAGSAPGFQSAPGGQLVQATDQWVGVLRARLILADTDGIRAPMMAQWLAQLGHDVTVLEGGIEAASGFAPPAGRPQWAAPRVDEVSARDAARLASDGGAILIDVRASMDYRKSHAQGALWSIRPRLGALADAIRGRAVILFAGTQDAASLAAADLAGLGAASVSVVEGGFESWRAAGLPVTNEPSLTDTECIDYLFFVHDRHDGNAEAARGYIAWEQGLVDQLDHDERAVFKIAD